MIRATLIILLLMAGFSAYGYDPVRLQQYISPHGYRLVRIVNETHSTLYCEIYNQNYYVDFYVNPQSFSRSYYEPTGYYEWRCQ